MALRVATRDEIRTSVVNALVNHLLKKMCDEDFDRLENRYKKRWMIKNELKLKLEASDDHLFLYYVKSIWNDPGVKRFLSKNEHDQELTSAR